MFELDEIVKIIPDAKFANSTESTCMELGSVSTDSRSDCSGSLFVALAGDAFDGHNFLDNAVAAGARALCVSRSHATGRPLPQGIPVLVVGDTLAAYQSLAACHREKMKCTLVAVTGSSGKTSTKEMIRSILQKTCHPGAVLSTEGNTNNHFGVPKNLLRITTQHRFAVIEIGINHFGEMEPLKNIARPDIAVITSIGNAHLEFLGDLEGVAKEKSVIFKPSAKPHSKYPVAIFPADAASVNILRREAKGKKLTFMAAANSATSEKYSSPKPPDILFEYLAGNLGGSSFSFRSSKWKWPSSIQWRLAGSHQVSNAAAAALAAIAAGALELHVIQGLASCTLPGMRMQITEINETTWINDAYNANPDSMAASIQWLAEFADSPSTLVFLGDMLELGKNSECFHLETLRLAKRKLKNSRIAAVGKQMCNAASLDKKLDITLRFHNSQDAASAIHDLVRNTKTVFLKASRGIAMEKIIPDSPALPIK